MTRFGDERRTMLVADWQLDLMLKSFGPAAEIGDLERYASELFGYDVTIETYDAEHTPVDQSNVAVLVTGYVVDPDAKPFT